MIGIASWGLTVVLAAIAGVHFYWAFGGLWPGDSEDQLVRTVVGDPKLERMPATWLTTLVAAALGAMAIWPLLLSRLVGGGLAVAGSGVLAAIFLARGVAGYLPAWQRRHPLEPFARLDRALYSPLCIVLGAGFLILTFGNGGT
jgi:hypothetical protein